MPHGMLADREEQGFGALRCQCLEHSRRIAGPWTVVESQHDFAVAQEVVSLELGEAKAWSSGGIDFNGAGNAKRRRITRTCRRRRGGVWPIRRSILRPCGASCERHRGRHGPQNCYSHLVLHPPVKICEESWRLW